MIDSLAKKFNTESFSMEIENRVKKGSMSYMEAIVHFCETNDMDVSVGAAMVKKCDAIKAKLEAECRVMNLLERTATLPGV